MSLGSPRTVSSDAGYRDEEQPGRLDTIRDDSNINGNDEDARARLVTDLISQLTVLGRDGNIDPDTHERLMTALDEASNIPQRQPQPQDQNPFRGMNESEVIDAGPFPHFSPNPNESMGPTFGGLNQAHGEDRGRSYPQE
jgi:hypothetical protein